MLIAQENNTVKRYVQRQEKKRAIVQITTSNGNGTTLGSCLR